MGKSISACMKKLPISKSVFKENRTEDCCYVDKTPFVKQLLNDHSKYWFLSRPRRFGKTLFIEFDEQEKNPSKFETEKWTLTKPEFQCQVYPI
jgi:hypothetical protein